jgi:hypothetical protein
MMDYKTFLGRKSQLTNENGFEPLWMPSKVGDFEVKDFQVYLTDWAIRTGRASIIADCGLGKTLMMLIFAMNVVMKTNKPFLIVTPLAVANQTVREGEKFGIEVTYSRDGKHKGGIVVTNYERLHHFDPSEFSGAAGDEISAIKAFDGKRRKQVTRFFCKFNFRLAASATPAPNDYIELGTVSEALGVMTQSDMLGYFFRETENRRHTVFTDEKYQVKWSFKPHSEQPFWRWVASWARAIQKPSDFGFCDDGYVLPPIQMHYHTIDIPYIPPGELFPRPAISLAEQRTERKRTIRERCEKVCELLDHDRPAIAWCHYNQEGDLLEEMLGDCVHIAGSDHIDAKEEKLLAFTDGQIKRMVTKPKIGCWGLNWQHCGDMTFFPSHSFEQFYQAMRRCYRFGRLGSVNVDIVSSEGESRVITGLEHKQEQAMHMFASIVSHMKDAMAMYSTDGHLNEIITPPWITSLEGNECLSLASA